MSERVRRQRRYSERVRELVSRADSRVLGSDFRLLWSFAEGVEVRGEEGEEAMRVSRAR